jgi:hypothetical protein
MTAVTHLAPTLQVVVNRESADAVARIRQIPPNAKVRNKILDLADLS